MTQWGLDTLFNPAKRHMDEEKRRLQSTREEVGDNSGGKRIDFETGKVVIHRSTDDSTEASTDGADTQSDAAATTSDQAGAKSRTKAGSKSVTKSADTTSGKPEPSAAAIRAAQRRGRQPR